MSTSAGLEEPHASPPNEEILLPFKVAQRQYIAEILGKKWGCDVLGHTLCVPTRDGRHGQLYEEDITAWVKAVCRGQATTAEPPGYDPSRLRMRPSTRSHSTSDWSSRGAVSRPPSRMSYLRSPQVFPSASLDDDSLWSSRASSGVPGVGLYGGRALRWLGEVSLDALSEVIIKTRKRHYLSLLQGWKKPGSAGLEPERLNKLFVMLGDALEMSREIYPYRIKKCSLEIGQAVHHWINSDPGIPLTKENAWWLGKVHICILPPLLAQLGRDDPHAADLAWDLLEVLEKVPLYIPDSGVTSGVICIIVKFLTYSPNVLKYSWLGFILQQILVTTLQRRQLSSEELAVIREMSLRRLERGDTQPGSSRPWEVAVFAQCAGQDAWFSGVVLGPCGLPKLLSTLTVSLSRLAYEYEEWEVVFRSLAFLSEHRWIAKEITPEIMSVLVKVVSGTKTPFPIRYWAVDTIRNIVVRRRSMLRTLVDEDAEPAFVSLISAAEQRRSKQKVEEYTKEANNRANELVNEMRRWLTDSITAPDR